VDRIEVERDRRDDGGGVEDHELERRRGERAIGLDAIARDEGEPDAE
jgi:hypothetical protein